MRMDGTNDKTESETHENQRKEKEMQDNSAYSAC